MGGEGIWCVGVERFRPTVAIFAARFGAQGEEVGSGGCIATRVRASLQESMVERLRGGVEMPGKTHIERNESGSSSDKSRGAVPMVTS